MGLMVDNIETIQELSNHFI